MTKSQTKEETMRPGPRSKTIVLRDKTNNHIREQRVNDKKEEQLISEIKEKLTKIAAQSPNEAFFRKQARLSLPELIFIKLNPRAGSPSGGLGFKVKVNLPEIGRENEFKITKKFPPDT